MDRETFTEIFNRHASPCYRIDRDKETRYLYGEVTLGGASGGSCWGGIAQSYSTGREASDANVPELDDLLAEIAPEISFIKYKVLLNNINWRTTEYCSNDYYGNYTEYGYKYIDCDGLYEALSSAGLV